MGACRVCSGRQRYCIPHGAQATGATFALARNPDRVAVIITGIGADLLGQEFFLQSVIVTIDGNNVADRIVEQSLATALVMDVETWGTSVSSDLLISGTGGAVGFCVTEIILRPESEEERLGKPLNF